LLAVYSHYCSKFDPTTLSDYWKYSNGTDPTLTYRIDSGASDDDRRINLSILLPAIILPIFFVLLVILIIYGLYKYCEKQRAKSSNQENEENFAGGTLGESFDKGTKNVYG
jgi:hypothetical protein